MLKKKKFLIPLACIVILLFGAWLYASLFWTFVKVPIGSMSNTILPGDRLVVSRMAQEIKRGDVVIFRYPSDPSVRYVSRIIGLPGESIEFNNKENAIKINGQLLSERSSFVKMPDIPGIKPLRVTSEVPAPAGAEWSVYYDERYKDEPRFDDDMMYSVKQPFKIPVKGDALPDEIKDNASLRKVYDADSDGRYDSDQYFCMGDNRDDALDSRFWGTVPRELIVGKPFLIYWSVESDLKNGDQKVRWNRLFTRLK